MTPELREKQKHQGTRGTLDESLDTWLAVPVRVTCRRAVLAISPEYRREIGLAGQLTSRPSDGASGTDVTLTFRKLRVVCQELELAIHDESTGKFLLASSGEVTMTRVETTLTAETIVVDRGEVQVIGPSKMDIKR